MAPFTLALIQRTKDSPFDAHRVMEITPALLYDCIYPPKSKAGDLAKLKWALSQNLYAGRAEILIYFQCRLGRNLKRCQQGHNSLEHTVFCIRSFDVLQFIFRNAPDLQQPLRLVFQNIQCVHTEPLHNICGSFGTNPFDKPGGKVALYAVFCSGHNFTPLLHLELDTILAFCPFTIQFQLYRICPWNLIPHSCKADQMVFIPPV